MRPLNRMQGLRGGGECGGGWGLNWVLLCFLWRRSIVKTLILTAAAAQVEESDSLEQIRPEIVIDGQTIEVEERQAIVLPCLVDHLGMIEW